MSKWKTNLYPSICIVTSAHIKQRLHVFSPASVGHLMGAVEHAHQCLLVVDARKHDDNGRVGDDQIQVVLGEVKVD